MDWSASGIKNEFRYELLDVFCRSNYGLACYGYLEGVKSATITEGYYTDAKSSATLELDASTNWSDTNYSVRIWHTATLGEESTTTCLGTFCVDLPVSQTYEYGRRTRTVNLISPLDKLATYYPEGDVCIPEGTVVYDWFNETVEKAGANGAPWDYLKTYNTKLPSTYIWEHGETMLTAINGVAAAIAYQAGVDTMGNITLTPYHIPSLKSTSYTFGTGEASITKVGVSIEGTEPVNRVVVQATKTEGDSEQVLCATAQVDAAHPWSYTKLGRWWSKSYTESQLEPFDQATLQAKANTYLAQNIDAITKYECNCLYVPVCCGDVVQFNYEDCATDHGLHIRAMVQQREITLDAEMNMKLILNEV